MDKGSRAKYFIIVWNKEKKQWYSVGHWTHSCRDFIETLDRLRNTHGYDYVVPTIDLNLRDTRWEEVKRQLKELRK